MSTPQAKRRRLNEAAKTLHKPFKSPFRTPLQSSSSSNPPSSDPPAVPEAEVAPITAPLSSTRSQNAPPKTYTPRPASSTLSHPVTKKALPSLTREIVQVRSDLQILTQAYQLATSTKDADLSVLIDTWRSASRAAAEEVFAGTRDKVNRMGGVAAWRDREKQQKEWRQKWDQEEMQAQKTGGDNEDEGEESEKEKENVEYEKYELYEEQEGKMEEIKEDVGDTDDDSFTMDMMLKTLNIDLKLIGYDQDAQGWFG